MENAAIDLKQLLDRGNLVETMLHLLRMYCELMPNYVLLGLKIHIIEVGFYD